MTIKADSVTIQNPNITNYIEEQPKRSTSKNNRKGDTKLMDEYQKDFLRSQLEDYIQCSFFERNVDVYLLVLIIGFLSRKAARTPPLLSKAKVGDELR